MGIAERKEREKEARREEIITAAIGLFSEKGLNNTTMDEIAVASELSKGTLYLYYKSKEDLYLEFVIRGIRILKEKFLAAIEGEQNPLVQLRNIGAAYEEFFKANKEYFRSFHFMTTMSLQTHTTEEVRNNCLVEGEELWDVVVRAFEQAKEQGLVKPTLDPRETAVIFWSSANALMTRLDYEADRWKSTHGLDLEKTLALSNQLLFEAILTPKGKKQMLEVGLLVEH